jgi:hypothetical protein
MLLDDTVAHIDGGSGMSVTPVSGSGDVTTQRPISPATISSASPTCTCRPIHMSSSFAATPSISKEHAKAPPVDRSVDAHLLSQPLE